jgi:PAS domain S-box-containing protein
MAKKDYITSAPGLEADPASKGMQVQASDEQFSPMVEQVKDCAIFMLDPQGHVASWNAVAERINGYSTAEIIGKHFSVFYTEEDVESGVPQRELEVARSAGSLELEGWRLAKDGSRFRALVTTSSLHDASGVLVGFGTMIRDLSERRSAEEARQKSHTMFERLFELAPEAVVVVDNHGVIRQVNQQAEVLFGYRREEMLGNRVELLMPYRFREGHVQHGRGYFKTPTVRSMGSGVELFGLHRDGREIPVDIMLNPIETSQGVWAFAVIRDITQQKQNIAVITGLNASLKIRIEELSASNLELESYSYSISHDLRAPLRHIIGFVDLLKERDQTALGDTSRHYLQVISRAAQKMGKLIDGLLAFSQLGRTDLRKASIDFDHLVRDIVQKLTEDAQERKIEWEIASLPTLVGDPALLHKVMVNLLENALKFTQTRARANIAVGALDESDDTLIYVRDNGVGFDSRYVGKLFGMFQRLHSEEEFEGVGVGLAHVRRIIARHGGRVWAEGEIEKGATIWLSLPKAEPGRP